MATDKTSIQAQQAFSQMYGSSFEVTLSLCNKWTKAQDFRHEIITFFLQEMLRSEI